MTLSPLFQPQLCWNRPGWGKPVGRVAKRRLTQGAARQLCQGKAQGKPRQLDTQALQPLSTQETRANSNPRLLIAKLHWVVDVLARDLFFRDELGLHREVAALQPRISKDQTTVLDRSPRCSLGPQGSKARHKLDSGPLKKGAQLSSGVTSSYLGSDKIRLQC